MFCLKTRCQSSSNRYQSPQLTTRRVPGSCGRTRPTLLTAQPVHSTAALAVVGGGVMLAAYVRRRRVSKKVTPRSTAARVGFVNWCGPIAVIGCGRTRDFRSCRAPPLRTSHTLRGRNRCAASTSTLIPTATPPPTRRHRSDGHGNPLAPPPAPPAVMNRRGGPESNRYTRPERPCHRQP